MRRTPRRPAQRIRVAPAVVALAATAALVGCGTETSAGDGSSKRDGDGGGGHAAEGYIRDSRWIPERVTVEGERLDRPARLTDAYVELRPGRSEDSGGASGGMPGCNRVGSDVTLHGDTLRVSDVVTTDMGCAGPVAAFEQGFLKVFDGRLGYEIDDEDGPGEDPGNRPATLTLTNAAGDTIELTQDPAGTERARPTGSASGT